MDQVWKGLSNLDPRDPGGFLQKTALKCKKTNRIATLNARSLRSPHKQLEICALAKKYKIDIIVYRNIELFTPLIR